MNMYYARSHPERPQSEWQPLKVHLENVANKAKLFADEFRAGDWAYIAGMWHDLGKYLPAWQKYLAKQIRGASHPNHSTAGAVLLIERLNNDPVAKIPAYVIAGHHAGLPDWYSDVAGGSLSNRLYKKEELDNSETSLLLNISEVRNIINKAVMPHSHPMGIDTPDKMIECGEYFHLWIRMLFSCQIDADFLDSEAFVNPERTVKRGGYPSLVELSKRFNVFMEMKQITSPDTEINRYRCKILQQCRAKAKCKPGLYSLTVPTGGGKTLSSMAFALKHALEYKKKRIIMAIPYTSIIEQTAKVFKFGSDDNEQIKQAIESGNVLFGEEAVLEHHSNIDPDNQNDRERLASENWDAPIIVTTNVQLFESLLGSRTSVCRKLHNIVNSVIILDEAQMLPPEYLKPILSVLRGLVKYFGVTVIVCTATQPAFSGTIGSGQATFQGLPDITEIIDEQNEQLTALNRVEVALPDLSVVRAWDDVARELEKYDQVLCIVNTRQNCRDLHALMPKGTIHLSANMCGEERSEVISDIKHKLKTGKPVRVISTQLIEAGVDIDFPVVYRALAGVDSIAQATGRCNREGKLNAVGEKGKVIVFQPPKASPRGLLRKGEDATKTLISAGLIKWDSALYTKYFEQFFASVNDFDKPKFHERLVRENNKFNFQFRTFAQNVRLIDDTVQRGIIVWYRGQGKNSLELIDYLRRKGPERWILRKLQRFIVNVPLSLFNKLKDGEYIEPIHDYWVQKCDGLYKPGLGLLSDSKQWDDELFIV